MNFKDHGIAVRSRAIDMLDAYYCTNILDKTMQRCTFKEAKTGSTLQRAMTSDISKIIFMQDGAPAHTAKVTQQKCSDIIPSFWKARELSGF